MKTQRPKNVPNPGSDAARKAGCICPVLDNDHGDPELGRIRGFYITGGCKLHDPKKRDRK